jgi:hypothetical protein
VRPALWVPVALVAAGAGAGWYIASLPSPQADAAHAPVAVTAAAPVASATVVPPAPAIAAVAASAPPPAASAPRATQALCDGDAQPLPDGAARDAALAERLRPQRQAFLRAAGKQADPLVKGLAAFRTDPAEADTGAVRHARDALVDAAVRDDDARLYAMAWTACKRAPAAEAGGCQLLSARRWAQLAPGDARPWLELAAAARVRRDEGELQEALYQVSQAQRLDSHRPAIAELALESMPAGLPRWSQMQLLRQSLRLDQLSRPAYGPVLQLCDRPAVDDANRRQVCTAIADLLQRDATTLTDLRVAATLGQRVGWPANRLQAVRDELEAAQRWIRQRGDQRALDCTTLSRTRPELETVVRLGELSAIRLLQARRAGK